MDVLYGISASYAWRARLYQAGVGTEFVLDARKLDDLPEEVRADVRRYGLRYAAAWVPHEWTRGWAGYEGHIMFRVRPLGFPELAEYSANNPETIYGRPHVALTKMADPSRR